MFARLPFLTALALFAFAISTADGAPIPQPANQGADYSSFYEEQNKQLSALNEKLQGILESMKDDPAKIEREMADLNMQKEMAKWAKYSFFSSLASAIGIIFLYCTLRQNTKSIEIASSNLTLSKETAQTQLRAYVGALINQSSRAFRSSSTLEMAVNFTNHGVTPALKFESTIKMNVRRHDEDFKDSPEVQGVQTMNLSLMPSEMKTANVGLLYPPEMIQRIKDEFNAGEVKLFVYGMVKYNDVYNNARQTSFRFCIQNFPGGTFGCQICDEGNLTS